MLAVALELLAFPSLVLHAVAFAFARVVSYALNYRLAFRMPLSASHHVRFLGASLVVVAPTLGSAAAVDHRGDYLYGFAIVVVTVPVFSFVVVKFWAFSKPRTEPRSHM